MVDLDWRSVAVASGLVVVLLALLGLTPVVVVLGAIGAQIYWISLAVELRRLLGNSGARNPSGNRTYGALLPTNPPATAGRRRPASAVVTSAAAPRRTPLSAGTA